MGGITGAEELISAFIKFYAGRDKVEILTEACNVSETDGTNQAVIFDKKFLINAATGIEQRDGFNVWILRGDFNNASSCELKAMKFENVAGDDAPELSVKVSAQVFCGGCRMGFSGGCCAGDL